jgi:hypothetical protein
MKIYYFLMMKFCDYCADLSSDSNKKLRWINKFAEYRNDLERK